MKLIDKSAIVAELQRLSNEWRLLSSAEAKYRREVYTELLSFINTLEVKEVDLEEKIAKYLGDDWTQNTPEEVQLDMIGYAKHFFELGLKTKVE